MKKYFFVLVLTAFISDFSFAQKETIFALRTTLKTEKADSNKVNTLNDLCRQIYLTAKYDTALYYGNTAKSLAEKIAYKKGVANAYNNIGNIYFSQNNYPEALKNHFASLKIQKEIGNNLGIGSSNNNIGNIYFYEGNYPEALKSYLAAMSMYATLPKTAHASANLAAAYNNIGNVYWSQNNYPDALKNYFSTLKIRIEIGDKHGEAACYANIGIIYFSENKYPEALKNDSISLNIRLQIGDEKGIAANYGNIGIIYFRENKYSAALKNFFASIAICEKINAKEELANAYINIAAVYQKQNKIKEGSEYINKSLIIGKTIGNKEIVKESFQTLIQLDSAEGNYRSALADYENYILYRDSLINQTNTKKIVQAQMNFDFEQKEIKIKAEQEKLNAINKEKLKRQKLINEATAGTLGFVFLISFLLFNRHRLAQKNKHQKQLNEKQKEQAIAVMETQEQERKRIAEDLHDSLGHLLSTAKLNLQTLPENQKNYFGNSLQLLNQASTEIHNITFNLMPRTLEEEGLIPAIHELATKITNAGSITVLCYVHNMETIFLEKQAQFNIYRIIQESVNNILKYAEAKEITIQLIKQNNDLVIMIEDDGKGFDIKQVKKGRGLKNISARSEWLHGKTAIDSVQGRGTTITIIIPV